MTAAEAQPLSVRICTAPRAHDPARAADQLADLLVCSREDPQLARLDTLLRDRLVRDLLAGVLGCSPYLSGLVTRDPARLLRILETAPEAHLQTLAAGLESSVTAAPSFAEAMRSPPSLQGRGGAARRALRPGWRLARHAGHGGTHRRSRCCSCRRGAFPLRSGHHAWRLAEPRRFRARCAHWLYRARHGQVRCRRAELLQRHRPHRLLRSRSGARQTRPRAARFLRAHDARPRAPAAGAHRRRLRLPH